MSTKEMVQVFFAANDRYSGILDVALVSLIEHVSDNHIYDIHVLYNELSQGNMDVLKKHETETVKITFDNVEKALAPIKGQIPDDYYFTLSSYHRLFIEKLYPDLDKAIYLDCDVLILDDISKLYEQELGDNIFACVNEQNCFLNPLFNRYITDVVGIDPRKYFNSGVLLMNLKKIREFNLLDKFIHLLTDYHFKSPMVDQDYLNILCRGKVLLLPNGWNKESVDSQALEGNLYIKHFALTQKPWVTENVEYFDLFWSYAKKSCYYNLLLQIFNANKNQSEEEKNAIMQGFIGLVLELLESEYTFKKIIIDKNINFD